MDCDEYGCTGTLTVGGFSLNTPAWDLPTLVRLWAEADIRGENKLLPGAPGRRPYPTRLDQSEHDLPFVIRGEYEQNGDRSTNPLETLQSHIEALWANVFQPVTTGDGTRPCVLTMPDGTTRSANCQFEPLRFAEDVYDFRMVETTVHITVLGGRFVPDPIIPGP